MAKRPGMTLAEHQVLGAELLATRNRLSALSVHLGNRYGKKLYICSGRALRALDRLRSDLDNLVCKEHPEATDAVVLNVYYGTAEPSNQQGD